MKTVVTWLLSIAVVTGCVSDYPPPDLPLQKNFTGAVERSFGPASTAKSRIHGIFIHPNPALRSGARGSDLWGLAVEDGAMPVLGQVSVLLEDGQLFYTDVPHSHDRSQSLAGRKLDPRELGVGTTCGSLSPDFRFIPNRDVLCSLDLGFGVTFRRDGVADSLFLRPLYQSRLYEPYTRYGNARPMAPSGQSHGGAHINFALNGYSGSSGGIGGNGSPGGNGANGQTYGQCGGQGGNGGPGGPGSHGGNGYASTSYGGTGGDGGNGTSAGHGAYGGHGGNGYPGAEAGRGADGARGDDGPDLQVVIRPIYSKFYPGEELVYMDVHASYRDTSNRVYRTEKWNYLFHTGDAFTITTVGGKGGDGGQGGRGGDGGNGGGGGAGGPGGNGGNGGNGGQGGAANPAQGISQGQYGRGGHGGHGGRGANGGNGGNGAISGRGGNGGNGGRGGDGGNISVTYMGSSEFVAAARQNIRFVSVPGKGGEPGPAGQNGSSGGYGYGGSGGRGGNGGAGGYGRTAGSSGSGGAAGSPGSGGYAGPANTHRPSDGPRGPNGVPGNIRAVSR
jgi:hypothetical protein